MKSRLLGFGLFYEGPEERGKTTKKEWDHDEVVEGWFETGTDKIHRIQIEKVTIFYSCSSTFALIPFCLPKTR